jgi:hypothetical protein
MVSYRYGVVKACGAEASKDFDEDKENVAYWFKVTMHFTTWNRPILITGSDLQ